MKTYLNTVHEEEYKYSDQTRTIGVLLNYTTESPWKDSLLYVFNHKTKTYSFFDTLVDLIDYLWYGNEKLKRAYMEEQEFDQYYDALFINGAFRDYLTWV